MDGTDCTPRGLGVIFKMRDGIINTIKLIVAVLIGIEVSYPPNPYKEYLIVGLTILIVMRYNLDKKIQEGLEKWLR